MRAARTDSTHREVVDTLRQCGWQVAETHRLPNWVDAVAHRRGVVRLVEIKTAKGKLQDSQQKLIDAGWPIHILRSATDALEMT